MTDVETFIKTEEAVRSFVVRQFFNSRAGVTLDGTESESTAVVPDILGLLSDNRLREDGFIERFVEAGMSPEELQSRYTTYLDSANRHLDEATRIVDQVEQDHPGEAVHETLRALQKQLKSDGYDEAARSLIQAGGSRFLWFGSHDNFSGLIYDLYSWLFSRSTPASKPNPVKYAIEQMEEWLLMHDLAVRRVFRMLQSQDSDGMRGNQPGAEDPGATSSDVDISDEDQAEQSDRDRRRYEISLEKVESLHEHLRKNIGKRLTRESVAKEIGLSEKGSTISRGLRVLRDWGNAEIEAKSRGFVCCRAADIQKVRGMYKQRRRLHRKKPEA